MKKYLLALVVCLCTALAAYAEEGERSRDIVREDGSRAEHHHETNGDHRVRDAGSPADGSHDRTYGNGHSDAEVREKEKDKDPNKQ